uniref:Uncharacterized protein n=1 Tax=Ciona intestinalis TaxID=7719 RepID=H2Y063_CIOIN
CACLQDLHHTVNKYHLCGWWYRYPYKRHKVKPRISWFTILGDNNSIGWITLVHYRFPIDCIKLIIRNIFCGITLTHG